MRCSRHLCYRYVSRQKEVENLFTSSQLMIINQLFFDTRSLCCLEMLFLKDRLYLIVVAQRALEWTHIPMGADLCPTLGDDQMIWGMAWLVLAPCAEDRCRRGSPLSATVVRGYYHREHLDIRHKKSYIFVHLRIRYIDRPSNGDW